MKGIRQDNMKIRKLTDPDRMENISFITYIVMGIQYVKNRRNLNQN